ncbi:MAG: alpha/beta fold hydrolase [Myxococcales bacterium]
MTALVVASVTSLLFLFWRAHLWYWSRSLAVDAQYVEQISAKLSDGGAVELRRLASTEDGLSAPIERVPVLLVHGLAMRETCFDLGETSLARHLQREGFDVWLLTLRSGRGALWPFGPKHCHFAAMVAHDLPYAVDEVLRRTGAKQLDIAALSMGGMIVYASLGRSLEREKVHRVVLFGAPGQIRPLGPLNWSHLIPVNWVLRVPMRGWLQTVAFAPRLVVSRLWRFLYNPRNLEPELERKMLWNIWEGISGPLGRDFVKFSRAGGTISVDGRPVLEGLARIDVPALFFAGKVDGLAPEYTVRAGFDAWGRDVPAVRKEFVLLGRATSGSEHDYGHCDIVIGRNAVREVFAPVVSFLSEGQPRRMRTSGYAPRAGDDQRSGLALEM